MPPRLNKSRSVTVLEVDQSELVKYLAVLLKSSGKLKVPPHMTLAKTASYKELAPFDPNWFYVRCAAILRRLYIRSPIGVKSLTYIFGGRNRKGHAVPARFCKASPCVVRKALQALEEIDFIEKVPGNRGRRLTSRGRGDIDKAAAKMIRRARQVEKLKNIAMKF